jgi:hypothetical protein
MTKSDKRLKNEQLFKHLNEQYAQMISNFTRTDFASQSRNIDCFCECSDKLCTQKIMVTLGYYEKILAHNNKYLIVPDHEYSSSQRIIEKQSNFYIVQVI